MGPQTPVWKDEVLSRSGNPTNEKTHLESRHAQRARGMCHESHVERRDKNEKKTYSGYDHKANRVNYRGGGRQTDLSLDLSWVLPEVWSSGSDLIELGHLRHNGGILLLLLLPALCSLLEIPGPLNQQRNGEWQPRDRKDGWR